MSSDEYQDPSDTETVWKQTSKWRQMQLDDLMIDIKDGIVVDMVNIQDAPLYVDVERIMMTGVDVSASIDTNTIPDAQLPFFNRLIQLTTFRDEPPSIAHDLLTFTGYESRKLHFRPRPNIKMQWRNHSIASEADYAVFTERSRTALTQEYMVIVEDNATSGKSYTSTERQLCGEMLVAAMDRYQSINVDQLVYGVIIKGQMIRYYMCTFSEEYLSRLDEDKRPNECSTVYRYPSSKQMALSLNEHTQRRTIILILSKIRAYLETNVF
ncbi:hypothetical protein DM01DRAFT_1345362 [Hesseltinella vesiculosa]|uniref:Uncharacterized protein n=1 Tax=Hesseltinella vesiculosa TaxID=101127 RepID=A0A1X2GJ38_9FUNG|nr:hypothetical protein DM01DRAFT_1345362 [Hesseltinella vesiculosa]